MHIVSAGLVKTLLPGCEVEPVEGFRHPEVLMSKLTLRRLNVDT